jgi:heavy-metal-associated domain-containing protein
MLAAFVLAYGLLGLLLPELAAQRVEATEPPTLHVAAPQAAVPLHRATLIIEKMECPPCAAHVHSLLGRKPFVHAFTAESGNQQVIVDYDSRHFDGQKLARLFPPAYRVTLISDAVLQ